MKERCQYYRVKVWPPQHVRQTRLGQRVCNEDQKIVGFIYSVDLDQGAVEMVLFEPGDVEITERHEVLARRLPEEEWRGMFEETLRALDNDGRMMWRETLGVAK